MSRFPVRCPSTTKNFPDERRRPRKNDADKTAGRFDARASTTRSRVRQQLRQKQLTVAALYERRNSRKGHLQIAPAVLETAAPCFLGGHRPPLQQCTLAAQQ